ncbi:hypothetical protein CMUS01_14019 [Colletotrichum musicola]|uniref:Uncharacterized protein n=1 Tax=Colletotrichum musicola TaxID=2175873 RepID=A0A8H6MSZ4_9PEZI|nr:hypothetical protein CMUS01_14019 [Colletotrichum musicola]
MAAPYLHRPVPDDENGRAARLDPGRRDLFDLDSLSWVQQLTQLIIRPFWRLPSRPTPRDLYVLASLRQLQRIELLTTSNFLAGPPLPPGHQRGLPFVSAGDLWALLRPFVHLRQLTITLPWVFDEEHTILGGFGKAFPNHSTDARKKSPDRTCESFINPRLMLPQYYDKPGPALTQGTDYA